MEHIIPIVLLTILVFLSAIFSGLETAYTSLSNAKIETMLENKQRFAKIIAKQHKVFNQTLSTLLIVNNIVNISASTVLAYYLSTVLNLDQKLEMIISIGIMTPIIVMFGEILPKLIAKGNPKLYAQVFCLFLEFLYYLFFPITWPMKKIGKKIYITNSEDEVKSILDIAQNEGVLEANESLMAQNALDLDSTKVKKHYVKIEDVEYVLDSDNIHDTLEKFKSTNYSRLPVLKDNQFIGIVHLKDIFHLEKGKIINYFKPIPFVSVNITLSNALEKLRSSKAQMAFVVENNNSQKVLGLITMEDILEEIVGEIYDEYDQDEYKQIFEISLDHFHVSGKVLMKNIIKQLELDLDLEKEENKLTLEQWLNKKIGHRIKKTNKYETKGIIFSVLEMPNAKNKEYKFEIAISSSANLVDDTNKNN